MARPKSNKPKLSWRMRQFVKDPDSFSKKRIDNMCTEDVLDEQFIRKYADYLNWRIISSTQDFSNEMVQDFYDRIDWYYFFQHSWKKINEDWIREFADIIDWTQVCKADYKFSKQFLREFKDKIEWDTYARWQGIDQNMMVEMKNYVDFSDCLLHEKFDEEFLERYLAGFVGKNWDYHYGWIMIARTQKLSEKFIDKWKKEINWLEVCENQTLSTQFMRDHVQYLDWETICVFQKLNEDFIKDHLDHFKKDDLVVRQNLSQDFIREYLADNVDWIGDLIYYWNLDLLTYKKVNNGLTVSFIIEMLERQYKRKNLIPFSKNKIKELIPLLRKKGFDAIR